tara:strand:- start:7 stop:393 length:387 start_codon:yes stop_codon:yes gene_type:complete
MSKKIKIPSNRNFGFVFCIVFLIIGLWPLLSSNEIRYWSIIISTIFLILGLLNSKVLGPLNKIWFYFGITLGKIISPLIMGIIFFFVVTPIGILMRLFKKDILKLKKNKEKSYWIQRNKKINSMKRQF